mgnify:CR=1 FL=1
MFANKYPVSFGVRKPSFGGDSGSSLGLELGIDEGAEDSLRRFRGQYRRFFEDGSSLVKGSDEDGNSPTGSIS